MEESKRKKIEEEQQSLQIIARLVEESLQYSFGRKLGFALFVFEFDNSGIGNYVSNAERGPMIKVLRETADRLELCKDIPKTIDSA